MSKVRVDKWLWAVRIFKSRSISNDACRSNKVKRDGENLKPSSLVEVGDHLRVRKNGIDYEYEILKLIDKRVGYEIAKDCYLDLTPEEELNKFSDWYIGKAASEVRDRGSGRPTKRERRVLEDFKSIVEEELPDDQQNEIS